MERRAEARRCIQTRSPSSSQRTEELGTRFAKTILSRDVESARACLTPWLQADFSPERLVRLLEPCYQGMPAPKEFTLDGNSCGLEDLEPNEFGPLTQPLPSEITKENYRKRMAVVDVAGQMKIGYFEPADPD